MAKNEVVGTQAVHFVSGSEKSTVAENQFNHDEVIERNIADSIRQE